MLFACSGITLPHGSAIQGLTRFVTSACLVREFNLKRNRDDNLRVGAADMTLCPPFFICLLFELIVTILC